MCTVREMMKRFERVDVRETAAESIEATSEDLVKRQQEQLYAGKNNKGQEITPFYRPQTIARKKKKGQPTDRVTLKDKGDFYRGIFVDVRANTVYIDSADPKAEYLIKKYKDIFGLGDDFKVKYIENLRPVFIDKIRQILQV